jgi:hypothetical protein
MTVDPLLLFNWIVSSPLATSYVDLDRADSYFLRRVNSADWAALIAASPEDEDARAIALMTATRAIEAYPGISDRRFDNFNSDQARYFPYRDVITAQGTADSATSTTLVDSTLADVNSRPDDSWNYGSIRITDGTGVGQIREVSDFDNATGTVTVAVAFSPTPDTTSTYELVDRIPDEIIRACCEIAYLYVPDATTGLIVDVSMRDKLKAEDVESFKIGDHSEKFKGSAFVNGYRIPPVAVAILNKWVTWFA